MKPAVSVWILWTLSGCRRVTAQAAAEWKDVESSTSLFIAGSVRRVQYIFNISAVVAMHRDIQQLEITFPEECRGGSIQSFIFEGATEEANVGLWIEAVTERDAAANEQQWLEPCLSGYTVTATHQEDWTQETVDLPELSLPVTIEYEYGSEEGEPNEHYQFVSMEMGRASTDWYTAYSGCREMQTELCTFRTEEEWNLGTAAYGSSAIDGWIWIGGFRVGGTETFVWTDGLGVYSIDLSNAESRQQVFDDHPAVQAVLSDADRFICNGSRNPFAAGKLGTQFVQSSAWAPWGIIEPDWNVYEGASDADFSARHQRSFGLRFSHQLSWFDRQALITDQAHNFCCRGNPRITHTASLVLPGEANTEEPPAAANTEEPPAVATTATIPVATPSAQNTTASSQADITASTNDPMPSSSSDQTRLVAGSVVATVLFVACTAFGFFVLRQPRTGPGFRDEGPSTMYTAQASNVQVPPVSASASASQARNPTTTADASRADSSQSSPTLHNDSRDKVEPVCLMGDL